MAVTYDWQWINACVEVSGREAGRRALQAGSFYALKWMIIRMWRYPGRSKSRLTRIMGASDVTRYHLRQVLSVLSALISINDVKHSGTPTHNRHAAGFKIANAKMLAERHLQSSGLGWACVCVTIRAVAFHCRDCSPNPPWSIRCHTVQSRWLAKLEC